MRGSSGFLVKGKLGKKGIGVNVGNFRLIKKFTKYPLSKGSNSKTKVNSNIHLRESMVNLSKAITVQTNSVMELEIPIMGDT